MKHSCSLVLLSAFCLLVPLRADPPRFAVSSSTIDGGGGAMADVSGRFCLTGTTGQPEPAPLMTSAGSRFTLQPGFWNASTIIHAPDAPLLQFLPPPSPGTYRLAWPASADGWDVELSTNLEPNSWTALGGADYALTPEFHIVTVTISSPRVFFRLRRL